MFAGDGTILAFPAVPVPATPTEENRLLRHTDYADPALDALFAHRTNEPSAELRFFELDAADGSYLASVAPVGGKRAGISAPLDWYLATLVPERVLLGPTHRLEKQSLLASAGALAIALGVALMFAWNLVRMRKAVGAARERARSAEARAKELGSYRLVERLGRGGMGEVWRAEHRLLARQAAIKLVRPEALRDPMIAPRIRERFRREAQTLATMRSLHTTALYDYGVTDDGTFFYVMELLDGVDLDNLVRDQGTLPAARVVRLLIQACQSLAEAHEAGLLHRDIKPANLFLCRCADEVDVLKVLDFGIVHTIAEPIGDPLDVISLPTPETPATPSGRLTQAGSLVGTPGYIAPEQAFGATIDARADLYALGCVAWWLLTGREVYDRDDDDDAIEAHLREPVPPLRPLVHDWLPDGLEKLVIACLAKRPQERPDDARAMIAALRAIEIPGGQAWSERDAHAWWQRHRPIEEKPALAITEEQRAAARVLVPSLADEPPSRPLGSEAKTIEH
jgi:serine/threonine protein kinase